MAAPLTSPVLQAVGASDYSGKLCVFVQAEGGWDPTSFCDPKVNTPGEKVINHWAENDEVRETGNILYASFADNAKFFEKYYERMLVVNGVDAQTNSHSVGVVHNWSGRNSEGYPAMTALMAATRAPELPLSYVNYGGFSHTAGLTRYTRLDNPALLRSIAYPRGEGEWPGSVSPEDSAFINFEDWNAMTRYRLETVTRLKARAGLLPGERRRLDHYDAAFASREALKGFVDALPRDEDLEDLVVGPGYLGSGLRRQVQLTVLAFKTGVAVSADLHLWGFDTHTANDAGQNWLFTNLTDAVDYLWEYAELHGVADRMIVVIGSDFGRTNFYNADDGKDHWPIGSFVVMEKNQSWTNRAVGETDGLHFAHRINPTTLERDDANGTIIYPKHVHKALRRYLGLENSQGAARFPFNNTEDFAFFG